MKIVDKIALGAVGVALITNPLTGQYILEGLDWGFQQIFLRGAYVNLVATVIIFIWVMGMLYRTRSQTKIPAKGKKTEKAGKFIAT